MVPKMLQILVIMCAELVVQVAGSNLYTLWVYYSGNACAGTPYNTYAERDRSCTIEECYEDGNMGATGVGVAAIDCTSDYKTSMRNVFGNSPYIMVESFSDNNCQTLSYAQAFFASGNCEGSPNLNVSQASHVIASLNSDGSAVLEYYHDSVCDSSELYATYSADKDTLATHECDENWSKWYYVDGTKNFNPSSSTSRGHDADTTASASNGIKTSTIVGIIVLVCLILVLVALGICCCKRRSTVKQTDAQEQPTASLQSGNTASLDITQHGQTGL